MPTLILDTAQDYAAVALLQADQVLYTEVEPEKRQSRVIMPMVRHALHQAGVAPPDLVRIVAATGPGSFTGIRVGLALASGLVTGRDIPLTGFSCFEALRAMGEGPFEAAVLPSGRSQPYYIEFDKPDQAQQPEVEQIRARGKTYVCWKESFGLDGAQVITEETLLSGFIKLAQTADSVSVPPLPVYIRPPDVTLRP